MSDNNSEKLKGMREDFIKAFSTEEGKRVLKSLESQCLAHASVFDKDPYIMAYQAGRRDIYLSIVNIMNLDIEQLEKISGNS